MPDIQPGLVHTVYKDRCGNCKLPRAAHVDGACMFDFTQFREESASDHLDCVCETVTEIGEFVLEKDGTLTGTGVAKLKKPLDYITLSFSV